MLSLQTISSRGEPCTPELSANAHGFSLLALAQKLLPRLRYSDPVTWWPQDAGSLIKDPKEAINVFDFEPVMRQNVPPAHFG